MTENIVYDDSNFQSADLPIILKGVKLGPDEIKIITNECEDWHDLMEDDIDSQCATITRKTHFRHAQKIKFLRYKAIFEDFTMFDVANSKLSTSGYAKYVAEVNNDCQGQ